MLQVKGFVNAEFTSNTYLLSHSINKRDLFLIDIGSSEAVLKTLAPDQTIKAIFLTHAHYDHIYGINDIISEFPECMIYCSEYARQGLLSPKLNLSFYHEEPITLKTGRTALAEEGMRFELFPDCILWVFETKGHNEGSLSFKIENYIFTGDSLIPELPVVTKLKSGNKEEAIKSLHKIRNISSPNDKICPGHGAEQQIEDISWEFYLTNVRN